MPQNSEPRAGAICPKCGSDKVVPAAQIDADSTYTYVKVKRGGLFGRSAKSAMRARVCGVCGFMEVYAEEPGALYDADVRRKELYGE
jgi:predicted nucleic-acid-binding Zn-ribbon protein